jgi:hypothetical protein
MPAVRGNTGQRAANVESNLSRIRQWAKRLVGGIFATQRTEITVQTDRIVLIRRRFRRVWCQQCGREVEAIAMGDATNLAGGKQLTLPGDAESGEWHVCVSNDGETLVCLESLLKAG